MIHLTKKQFYLFFIKNENNIWKMERQLLKLNSVWDPWNTLSTRTRFCPLGVSITVWHSSVNWYFKNLQEHVYVIFIIADVVVAGTKSYEHSAWWPPAVCKQAEIGFWWWKLGPGKMGVCWVGRGQLTDGWEFWLQLFPFYAWKPFKM